MPRRSSGRENAAPDFSGVWTSSGSSSRPTPRAPGKVCAGLTSAPRSARRGCRPPNPLPHPAAVDVRRNATAPHSGRSAASAPITVCSHARSSGLARRIRRRAQSETARARAHRVQRAGDRVAAVLEHEQPAGLVAADAQLLDHGPPADRLRARRVAVLLAPGAGGEDRLAARAARRAAAAGARSGRCASGRGCRRARARSPGGSARGGGRPRAGVVVPRGGIAWSSRTITLTTASRGRPRSRTRWPTIASSCGDRVLEDLRAEAADRPALGQRPRQRRLARGHAEARARAARTSCPAAPSRRARRRRRC